MKHAVRNTVLVFLAVAFSLPYALATPRDWKPATIVLVTYGEIPRRAVLLYLGDSDNNVVPLMNDKQLESQLEECGFGACEGLLSLIDKQTCSNDCAVTSTVWYSARPDKGEVEVRWHDGGVSDVNTVPDTRRVNTP